MHCSKSVYSGSGEIFLLFLIYFSFTFSQQISWWAYQPYRVIKTGSQSGKVLPDFYVEQHISPDLQGPAFPGSDFPEDLIHWRYLVWGFQSCSEDTWFFQNISIFSRFEKIQNLILGVLLACICIDGWKKQWELHRFNTILKKIKVLLQLLLPGCLKNISRETLIAHGYG